VFSVVGLVVASWRRGVVASWRCGVVASWRHGVVALWRCSIVASWRPSVMVPWRHGVMASWRRGVVAFTFEFVRLGSALALGGGEAGVHVGLKQQPKFVHSGIKLH
jgi:hypothetical protein